MIWKDSMISLQIRLFFLLKRFMVKIVSIYIIIKWMKLLKKKKLII